MDCLRTQDFEVALCSLFGRAQSLLLGGLVDQGLVDVRNDAAASNGRLARPTQDEHAAHPQHLFKHETGQALAHLDQGVQLLITTDGKLQVARCNALHLSMPAHTTFAASPNTCKAL